MVKKDKPKKVDKVEKETFEENINQLTEDLEDSNNQKMRAIADYQNLKRRVDEERRNRQKQVTSDVVTSFLPILDDIDRALLISKDTAIEEKRNNKQEWMKGIQLVKEKFLNILTEEGIEEIDTDVDFDPRLHEAIGYVNGNENEIIEVVEKGFCLDEVVIRPARVIIGQKKETS
ncbi:MAG: nucleotide exchange factor GrpE [Dehalococcoidia bacterium]|jgi:molecular chaperone GrpE|nr:nucleotide exchange factor GrpE [Dehalococcoidia bacterium]